MTAQTRVSMIAVGAAALSLIAASPAHAQYPYPAYPLGGGYSRYGDDSSLRIQAKPSDAEVFLDGYLVGNVDDFDGIFQRLRLRSGEHEIAIYKEGYRTIRQKVYLSPGGTFRVQHDMERLRAGETPEPRPVAQRPPATPQGQLPGPRDRARGDSRSDPRTDPRGGDRDDPRGDPRGDGRGDPRRGANDFGAIAIRVQPANAEILIDGERWDHGAGGDRLIVQVPSGRRHVEIRLPGHRMFSQDVNVRPGETVPLNVSLRSEEN